MLLNCNADSFGRRCRLQEQHDGHLWGEPSGCFGARYWWCDGAVVDPLVRTILESLHR